MKDVRVGVPDGVLMTYWLVTTPRTAHCSMQALKYRLILYISAHKKHKSLLSFVVENKVRKREMLVDLASLQLDKLCHLFI